MGYINSPVFHQMFIREEDCMTSPKNNWMGGDGQGHWVVLLGKTLYTHSASPHRGLQMDTGKFNAEGVTL